MRLTQHIVVGVVGRCHLQTTCTKLDVHITVFDDGNDTIYQRNNHLATLQPLVLRVLGVDTHSGITHDGLRTRGGNNGIIALGILVDDVAGFRIFRNLQILWISHIVFQVEQMALLFLVDNLLSREGGQRLGVPVDHAQATIDESLVVEINEHLDHTFAALLVHGEGGAVPVAAGT